jgi:response regulator RpfG family c-di-GMP phosphodiesterase
MQNNKSQSQLKEDRDRERERLIEELLRLRNQFNETLQNLEAHDVDAVIVAALLERIGTLEVKSAEVSSKLWTLLGLVGKRNPVC